jgi:hypothetical protein
MEYDRKGYTLRHRKRWDGNYHLNRLLWVLMDWFIDNAAYEDKTVKIAGKKPIKLKRGQVVYTERQLAKFFKIGRQRIRTCQRSMILGEFLTQQVTQGLSIATVLNYDRYQFENSKNNPASNHSPTHAPTHVPLNKVNKYNKRGGENSPTETEKRAVADAAKRRIERTTEHMIALKATDATLNAKVNGDLKAKLKAKAKDQSIKF